MIKVKLIDLVGKDVNGIKANVRRQGGKYHYDYQDVSMIRKLSKVYIKKEKGCDWLYWEWYSQNGSDVCPLSNYPVNDCGYSGIGDSDLHPIKEAYILIDN